MRMSHPSLGLPSFLPVSASGPDVTLGGGGQGGHCNLTPTHSPGVSHSSGLYVVTHTLGDTNRIKVSLVLNSA